MGLSVCLFVCIVNCTSGYKSNKETVFKLSAPKDLNLRTKWAKAIPRQDYVVNDNTYVCEKHFIEDDIIRFWQSGSESTLLVKVSNFVLTINNTYVF